jgi:hypothetical protein
MSAASDIAAIKAQKPIIPRNFNHPVRKAIPEKMEFVINHKSKVQIQHFKN